MTRCLRIFMIRLLVHQVLLNNAVWSVSMKNVLWVIWLISPSPCGGTRSIRTGLMSKAGRLLQAIIWTSSWTTSGWINNHLPLPIREIESIKVWNLLSRKFHTWLIKHLFFKSSTPIPWMYNYIIKRILLMIPPLLGAAILVFFLLRLIPGDVCELRLAGTGLYADPAEIELCQEKLGLNQPMIVQFFDFLIGIVTFDLGESMTCRPCMKNLAYFHEGSSHFLQCDIFPA